jgi:hypothetical protein
MPALLAVGSPVLRIILTLSAVRVATFTIKSPRRTVSSVESVSLFESIFLLELVESTYLVRLISLVELVESVSFVKAICLVKAISFVEAVSLIKLISLVEAISFIGSVSLLETSGTIAESRLWPARIPLPVSTVPVAITALIRLPPIIAGKAPSRCTSLAAISIGRHAIAVVV